MSRNKFLRTCIVCRQSKNKKDLFRYVAINGIIYIDFFQKLEGRGFYTCKNLQCIENLKIKVIKNSLKTEDNIIFDKSNILTKLKENLILQIKNTLNLCNKAGILISKQNNMINALKNNKKFQVIFLAKDISDNSLKKIKFLFKNNVKITNIFNKSDLGESTGNNYANIVGILESSLGESILNQLQTIENLFEGACCNGNGNEKNS